MGNSTTFCGCEGQEEPIKDSDIKFREYSSKNDYMLKIIENDNNYLTEIPLSNYVNYLASYTSFGLRKEELPTKNRVIKNSDTFLIERIKQEDFEKFIETVLLNDELVKADADENERKRNFFVPCLVEVFKSTDYKMVKFFKMGTDYCITKFHLLGLGLLYCKANDAEKIKLFFDVLSDEEKGTLSSCEDIDELLAAIFIMATYGVVSARNLINKEFDEIETLDESDFSAALENQGLKDIKKLIEKLNIDLFGENDGNELTYDQFKRKFVNGCDWIFNPKGIRHNLEECAKNDE